MTGLLLALITVVIAVGGIGMAQAQGVTPPAPSGLVAVNGPNPGEALLSLERGCRRRFLSQRLGGLSRLRGYGGGRS